jgi:hypothetical protein
VVVRVWCNAGIKEGFRSLIDSSITVCKCHVLEQYQYYNALMLLVVGCDYHRYDGRFEDGRWSIDVLIL